MFTSVGVATRLARIVDPHTGRGLVLPLDDSLISGPAPFATPPEAVALAALRSPVPASIMAFPGLVSALAGVAPGKGRIVNLTASTTRSSHTEKVQTSTVEDAIALGADCCAVHVNITADGEGEMLSTLGRVSGDCARFGMPLLVICYPRSAGAAGDDNYWALRASEPDAYADLVAHCVRVAVDLGASIVKTQYPGSVNGMRQVIRGAGGVPVLVAGGPLCDLDALLAVARGVVESGGAGMSVGRNVFQRNDAMEVLSSLSEIVLSNTETKRDEE